MKKQMLVFAALLLVAPLVRAQDDAEAIPAAPSPLSRFSLGAHLSYWDAKDLDDLDLDGTFGFGVIGQYRFLPQLALEMRISGYMAGESDDLYVDDEGWYDNDTTVVVAPLEAGLVGFLPLTRTFSLYAGPGVGYYFFDGETTLSQGPLDINYDIDMDDEAGFYALAGVRAQLARNVALFLEGKYTWVETTIRHEAVTLDVLREIEITDVDEDIDFGGLSVEAGMIFTF